MTKKRGAGEGSIYEEAAGKWVASITVGYAFRDGKRKRIRKKFSAHSRREVQEKLTAALRSQQTGYDIAPQRQTVAQFLNYWLDSVVPGATKPKTMTFYRYISETHLIPSIGQTQIQKLSPQHVQALLNDKLNAISQRTGKQLSPRSVRHIHRTLCTALETATKYGIIQRNVATLIDPPRAPKAEMKFLSVDQARAVLAAAAAEPLYALYVTILSLGLRLGEALGLGWDDVDLRKGQIRIRRALQRVDGAMTLLEPKMDKHRTIELPAVAIAALREHQSRQRHAQEWAGSEWKGNPWNLAFTSSIGTPLDERSVLRRFQERILKTARVPKMRIHDLRHSAVAILLAQGVNARSICEMLGHSSVAFTLQVYGHLMEETKRETANRMDNALAPSVAPLTDSVRPN